MKDKAISPISSGEERESERERIERERERIDSLSAGVRLVGCTGSAFG